MYIIGYIRHHKLFVQISCLEQLIEIPNFDIDACVTQHNNNTVDLESYCLTILT